MSEQTINRREFLKNLDENENLSTQILEVGDGLAISKKVV